jgi:hypothetical protein
MVKRAGKKAGLPFQAHAHMLRHTAGYTLANAGKDTRSIQAYLGHKDIRHTVRYTELSPTRSRTSSPTDRLIKSGTSKQERKAPVFGAFFIAKDDQCLTISNFPSAPA